jgi:hypothetical protein
MQQISTLELLVTHPYQETTIEEAAFLRDELEHDTALAASYEELQEIKNALDDAGGDRPGASIIRNILEFSRQQELVEVC